jgi:hypothetical protein
VVEVSTESEVKTYSDISKDTSIVALQQIMELEYAEAISYEEAWELGESLLEFFEAFSAEGIGNGSTDTGTSS